MRFEDSDMANGRPALLDSDGQFVRRVLIVVGIAALAALLWMLSEILLVVFASALLAVILRAVAALFSAHARVRQNWSVAVPVGGRR
jgi:predicted PurR-regulated permease PerM